MLAKNRKQSLASYSDLRNRLEGRGINSSIRLLQSPQASTDLAQDSQIPCPQDLLIELDV